MLEKPWRSVRYTSQCVCTGCGKRCLVDTEKVAYDTEKRRAVYKHVRLPVMEHELNCTDPAHRAFPTLPAPNGEVPPEVEERVRGFLQLVEEGWLWEVSPPSDTPGQAV